MPGIGPIIARTLIAKLTELGTLGRRQAAALAGLAPWTRQSGGWRGKSFIGGGRASVQTENITPLRHAKIRGLRPLLLPTEPT